MAGPSISIKITGVDDAIKLLDAYARAIPDGTLGEVYSSGANQGSGDYEHFVQSSSHQASVHAGRWHTEADAAHMQDGEIDRLADKYFTADLSPDAFRRAVKHFTEESVEGLLDFMRESPPPLAGSLYARTGTLYASWVGETKI